jgi:hypothetical protein
MQKKRKERALCTYDLGFAVHLVGKCTSSGSSRVVIPPCMASHLINPSIHPSVHSFTLQNVEEFKKGKTPDRYARGPSLYQR